MTGDCDGIEKTEVSFDSNKIQWPLSFSLTPPLTGVPPRRWWSLSHYRGPNNQPIRILYSSSRPHSEVIAQGFLNEPVLGFDMEWPWDPKNKDKYTRLKDKVALIQIACERKVALFHIALHDGQTTEELIAPSLRHIIESENILKTGVAILNADFRRLKEHFHLQPRGAFELSHLHRVLTFESHRSQLCSLSKQTECHLGLPLYKGSVRSSNWSAPLDDNQRAYAADDAYACYMLFHCMNAKRLQMDPIPPLPKLAESQSSSAMEPAASVQPESSGDDAALALRKLLEAQKLKPRKDTHVEETKIKTPTTPKERQHHVQEKTEYGKSPVRNPVPEPSPRIYSELVSHRKELAKTLNYAPYIIATNKMLEALATYRPSNRSELAKIRGIGAREVEEYGDEWLQIIAKDLAEHPEETRSPLQPITPNRRVREKRNNHKPMDPTLTQELFQRLSEHRKACAATNKWAAFRVASNSTLNDLVQSRPSNEEELLRVEGIGKHKASLYGPDWLRIISEFEAKHDLQPESSHLARNTPLTHPQYQIQSESDSEPEFEHQPSEHPSKRMRVRNIGRSKEIILTKPLLSSNPSLELADALFKAGEASIEKDRVEHDDSYESTLEVSMTASISLKRKRTDDATSPSKAIHTSPSSPSPNPILNSITTPTPTDPPIEVAPPPQRLSWQQQLLRRKLDACVKSVIWATNPKHTQPIVSEDTLHCLVTTLPQTLDEFHKVPGIQYFIQACQRVNKDLWSTFSKWIEVQGLVKSSSTSGQ